MNYMNSRQSSEELGEDLISLSNALNDSQRELRSIETSKSRGTFKSYESLFR